MLKILDGLYVYAKEIYRTLVYANSIHGPILSTLTESPLFFIMITCVRVLNTPSHSTFMQYKWGLQGYTFFLIFALTAINVLSKK